MKLSEIKSTLNTINQVNFKLPNGEEVPKHFHVTEVGHIQKSFIDCGGTMRNESVISFQLYTAEDYDHRLGAKKLHQIISLSERTLNLPDSEIEVEYQGETIGKYGLSYVDGTFQLTPKHTDCLAKDSCGIPTPKVKVKLQDLKSNATCCAPETGCC